MLIFALRLNEGEKMNNRSYNYAINSIKDIKIKFYECGNWLKKIIVSFASGHIK